MTEFKDTSFLHRCKECEHFDYCSRDPVGDQAGSRHENCWFLNAFGICRKHLV